MKFYTRFNLPPKKSVDVGSGSMTCQEFKDECDINTLVTMPNYGINPLKPPTRIPSYGDFTDERLLNFQESQNILAEATQLFEALPSVVRERFSNDPAKLIDFVNNKDNMDEAKKLGLLNTPLEDVSMVNSLKSNVTESVTSPQKPSVEATLAVAE